MKAELLFPPIPDLKIVWLIIIGKIRLGIYLQEGWCISTEGQIRMLSEPTDMMPLLPLLELDRGQFYEYLHRIVQNRFDLKEIILSFPETLLLEFAFESSVSEYWPLKALDWLASEATVDSRIYVGLKALLYKPWATQRLKQRIGKIVKLV